MLIYTVDCRLADSRGRSRRAGARWPATAMCGARPTRATACRRQAPADWRAEARPRPVVVGFGPCGLFAALILAQMGLAPIVLERGKPVRERTKDTWGLWRQRRAEPAVERAVRRRRCRHLQRRQAVEPDQRPAAPDAQGAATSSSRPARREEILYVAKPHIGTFRLVGMVEKMRADIVALGGEVRFGQQVVDLLLEAAGRPDAPAPRARRGAGRR